MPRQRNLVQVVHAGAPEGAVAYRKSCRFDKMGLKTQAGGKPEHRAGVLGDIGLEQRDSHRACHGAAAVTRRDRSRSIINWYKPPRMTALAGLRSAGKGANKPARWCCATCLPPPYPPRLRGRAGWGAMFVATASVSKGAKGASF